MKLTKFVHSCVLVQDGDDAVLFDPGIFSWGSGLVKVDALPQLYRVFISHKHPDHLSEPFIRALVQRFPDVQWIAPADSHAELRQYGVANVSDQNGNDYEVNIGEHAHVEPFSVQVQNMIAHWNGKVTSPGDTHNITESKDVLLLPIQAPWGTTVKALELALQLKPKFVLPIHDWMWIDQWREGCYDRFADILGQAGTVFLQPVDGKPLEIDLAK